MAKTSVRFSLSKLDGKHDVKEIKQGLDALPGVLSVSISNSAKNVTVDFDTTGVQSSRIKQQLEKMGYDILDSQ